MLVLPRLLTAAERQIVRNYIKARYFTKRQAKRLDVAVALTARRKVRRRKLRMQWPRAVAMVLGGVPATVYFNKPYNGPDAR